MVDAAHWASTSRSSVASSTSNRCRPRRRPVQPLAHLGRRGARERGPVAHAGHALDQQVDHPIAGRPHRLGIERERVVHPATLSGSAPRVNPPRRGCRRPSTAPPRRGCPAPPRPAARAACIRVVSPADAAARSQRAEQHADRPGVVGHHQPPGGQVVRVLAAAEALAALRAAQPDLPLEPVGVERPHRHARLHHRDRAARRRAASARGTRRASAARARAPRPACGARRGRARCGGRRRGRRAGSAGARSSIACAPRKRSESTRSRSRSAGGLRPGARRERVLEQAQVRELGRELGVDPARDDSRRHRSASDRRAASAASPSSRTTCPPPSRRGART